MISRGVWVLVALTGCGGDAPSARARVLDKIPAGVVTIAVADGRALAHPRFRPVVDALRGEVPAGLDCVVDAALAGEQVAIGIGAQGDVTIALATKARVQCPALSQIDAGLWIATLGAGAPAAGASVMTEQPRARPFLRDAPIALATTQRGLRILGTAQPDPLAGWVAFDARDVPAATAFHGTLVAAVKQAAASEAIAPVTQHVTIERTGSQVVARLGATSADLAVALRETLVRARATDPTRTFPCPAAFAAPVLACQQRACSTPLDCAVEHVKLEVYSLASAVDEILAARKEAVIVNGRVEGVRLRDDLATYGLQRGDMVVAVDGKRVTAVEQLAPYLQNTRAHTQLIVARSQRFGTIELVEQ